MKILFYISTIKGGGAARVMVNLANCLLKENEVFFATNFGSNTEYKLDKKFINLLREQYKSTTDDSMKKVLLRQVKNAITPKKSRG